MLLCSLLFVWFAPCYKIRPTNAMVQCHSTGLFFAGLVVCLFFVPRSLPLNRAWMYIGLGGGFLFILTQLVLLVEMSRSWSDSWAKKMERASTPSRTRCWWVTRARKLSLPCYSAVVLISVDLSAVKQPHSIQSFKHYLCLETPQEPLHHPSCYILVGGDLLLWIRRQHGCKYQQIKLDCFLHSTSALSLF